MDDEKERLLTYYQLGNIDWMNLQTLRSDGQFSPLAATHFLVN